VLANRKLLVQPIVNVEVASYVSRSATLLGAVVRPGVYPLYAPQRLSTILALAGGNRESSDIIILRREGKPELRVTVEEVASGGDKDPFIDGGDLIFVPEPDRFYVYGQVRQPGGYAVRPGMTIRQALAQGGGPTEAGTEDNLRLFRNGQRMAAEQLDTPIQDGDVVFVRERVF
jgi:polysaccharide export outer membrane protein